jgi:DNA mismatch endonuclease (patch repair protein)
MAAIRSGNTKPELIVRKAIHAAGLRFRLHVRNLPGKPDLVLARHRAIIFVNGCFWHHHDCHLFKWPATRAEFWQAKISQNVANDARAISQLRNDGWRVGVIWECALKGRTRLDAAEAMQEVADWIKSPRETLSIRGE